MQRQGQRETETEIGKYKTTPKELQGSPSSVLKGPLQELLQLCLQIKAQEMATDKEGLCLEGNGWMGGSSASPRVMGRTGTTKLTHCELHFQKKNRKEKDVSLI